MSKLVFGDPTSLAAKKEAEKKGALVMEFVVSGLAVRQQVYIAFEVEKCLRNLGFDVRTLDGHFTSRAVATLDSQIERFDLQYDELLRKYSIVTVRAIEKCLDDIRELCREHSSARISFR